MSEAKPMTVGDVITKKELIEIIKIAPDDTPVKVYYRMMRTPHNVVAVDYDEIMNEIQISV